ncbi:MAG TPA: type II toxin-antitoxin system VapC family toxin [Acidimicrobiia bacterium]|nr:type II toxin-antitoxin system VapC family toxin [Acidimicrobiia bacterium]
MPERLVVDASALVELAVGGNRAPNIAGRLRGADLHGPAHLDAEVLSALGRLHRAGRLSARQVTTRLDWLAAAPIERHPLAPLLTGAWRRRHRLRLAEALYAELAQLLGATLVTTDAHLAAALPGVELVGGQP